MKSIQEKEQSYRTVATRWNLFGHWYVGFEGVKCSEIHTDDKAQAMQCAWVWGVREKKWLKKPQEVGA